MAISFEDQCEILGQFWIDFKEDESVQEFITYNDIGLPLAWFISTGVVTANPMAEDYVGETFSLFLTALDITEEEIEDMDSLDEIMELVASKQG